MKLKNSKKLKPSHTRSDVNFFIGNGRPFINVLYKLRLDTSISLFSVLVLL